MNIGLLGPQGSYTEKAAKQWIAAQLSDRNGMTSPPVLHYRDDIQDVILLLCNGAVDIAVLPVENSIEGSVGVTLDMLLEHDVSIIGESVIAISHCLLSKGKKENIKLILSHPQGLAQCRQFLRENFRDIEQRSTGSTSHAAKLASEFEEMAAIASPEAAEMYGLNVLMANIQDRKHNYTRFLIMARPGEQAFQKEQNDKSYLYKTSLIIYLQRDRPGALYEMLGEFACRGINLTRIESRPSKKALGDYMFYVDLEGNASEINIKEAIYNIAAKVGMLRMLGSYPASGTEKA